MTGGADLLGGAQEKRRPGRPKGSKTRAKQAKDLSDYLGVVAGGSTALQLAKFALVTPAMVKAAGGSVGQAYVDQAVDLSRRAREADQLLAGEVEALILKCQERLDLGGKGVWAAVDAIVARIQRRADPLPFAAAFELLAKARADLLPYTDQRQPQKVDVAVKDAPPPVAIFMGGGGEAQTLAAQGFGPMLIPGEAHEVSSPRSHGEPEA